MGLNRKADASMWWIIIGAVIALVVLIILLVIFTNKTGGLESGLSACDSKGGICSNQGCPQGTLDVTSTFGCSSGDLKCCLGAPKSCKGLDDEETCGTNAACKLFGNKYYCLDTQQQS